MKINRLKINSYGKVQNKEINLNEKINIIYGENESGKSTIFKFILNSLYGTSKNKKGKNISDYEQYKPWSTEEFSGKLEYELDNGEKFEIYREFSKKNPKIFNENSEDISKQFNIDKNKGNEFFYEQTKIDEDLFISTSAILQEEVKLEKGLQNILIQKIANIMGTGEDTVSYKKATDKLNKRQLEEIGTDRTKEKPINLIKQEIKELELKKSEIELYNNLKEQIEEKYEKIKNENLIDKIKYELITEIKKIKEKENIENEKIKINNKIKNENSEKINKIKNNIEKTKKEKININKNKQKNKLIYFIFGILILINILWYIFINKNIENKIIKNIFLLTVPMYLIFIYFNKKVQKNKLKINNKNKEEIINNYKNEINILENNNKNIENEILKIKNEINLKLISEKEKIQNNYFEKINNYEINNLINSENINYELEKIQNKINNQELEIHKLNFEKNNIEKKYNELISTEEKLNNLKEEYKDLANLDRSINIVRDILQECYEEMRNTVTPKFTTKISKIISKITNNKYTNVKLNDNDGLIVELENGNYVPADRLSNGTIDQMYLALRLAMLDELTEERIPIILDESFSHYDDNRLKNILKYLHENSSDRQIIIFTCNDREKRLLESLNITFNYIDL